jgi:hypothetical protein
MTRPAGVKPEWAVSTVVIWACNDVASQAFRLEAPRRGRVVGNIRYASQGPSAIECCYAATGIRISSTMTEIVEWTNMHVNFFHTN